MTHTEAVKYLDSLVNYEKTGLTGREKNFDLEKLRRVLTKAGNPDRSYRSVHVAGTKGKGSTCTYISSILESAGYRVGLYTSPHLIEPEERIKINGSMITGEAMALVLDKLLKYIGPGEDEQFTYFEMYTLMAFLYFSIEKVDFAVFETGMGGRLDATNILTPEVCVITPVSYDHMQVLGDTLEKIAGEKAAIIKKGSIAVSSLQKENVLEVIKKRCDAEGVPLYVAGKDIKCNVKSLDAEGSVFDIRTMKSDHMDCRTRMPGKFQLPNAATAVCACELLMGDKTLSAEAVKRGLEKAFIAGRMEVVSKKPLVVIDGAHNGESVRELMSSVQRIFKYNKLILILGVSKDKDIKAICANFAPAADIVIATCFSSERAFDPYVLRGFFRGKDAQVTGDVKEALGMAFSIALERDMILIAGSLFLAGEARELLIKSETMFK